MNFNAYELCVVSFVLFEVLTIKKQLLSANVQSIHLPMFSLAHKNCLY